MARRARLTREIAETVVKALTLGAHRKDAATLSGIGEATLRRWMARGAKESAGPYADFRASVLEAESRAKMLAMGCIARAIRDGDWRAAAYFLERKWPHEYSDKSVLFLVHKALQEMEAAAEAAGTPLPEGAWEQAWAKVAQEMSLKLPHAKAGFGGLDAELDGFGSEDDLDQALKLLGAGRGRRPR